MAYQNFYSKRKPEENENLQLLKNRIKNNDFSGVYVFSGEEEYMKRFYFSSLCKAAKDLDTNVTVIDEENFSYASLYDAVTCAPGIDYSSSFFADEETSFENDDTIRVIKLFAVAVSSLSDKEKSYFEELLSSLPEKVCVVFYYPYNQKKQSEYNKSITYLEKIQGVTNIVFYHESKTSNQLKKWVKKHFDANRCVIDENTVSYFIECVGNDMSTLLSEIEKLCSYAKIKQLPAIYERDIDFICIKTDEARLEDLTNAIVSGNYKKSIKALSLLKNERVEEMYVFGAISKKVSELSSVEYYKNCGLSPLEISEKTSIKEFVVKLHTKTISDIKQRYTGKDNPFDKMVKLVSEYDTKLKSSPVNKYVLLENMVFKLCKLI